MGDNAAFTAFEHTVVAVYNHGALSRKLLKELMEPYRGSDIDSGGKVGLCSRDGLEVEEIVVRVWGLVLPKRPMLPKDHKTWTERHHEANEEYQERLGDLFNAITEACGWR